MLAELLNYHLCFCKEISDLNIDPIRCRGVKNFTVPLSIHIVCRILKQFPGVDYSFTYFFLIFTKNYLFSEMIPWYHCIFIGFPTYLISINMQLLIALNRLVN